MINEAAYDRTLVKYVASKNESPTHGYDNEINCLKQTASMNRGQRNVKLKSMQ
jgi:hypothetical protein